MDLTVEEHIKLKSIVKRMNKLYRDIEANKEKNKIVVLPPHKVPRNAIIDSFGVGIKGRVYKKK